MTLERASHLLVLGLMSCQAGLGVAEALRGRYREALAAVLVATVNGLLFWR